MNSLQPLSALRADLAIRKVRAQAIDVPISAADSATAKADLRHIVMVTVETNACEGTYYGWTIGAREAIALREMVAHVAMPLIGQDAGEIAANLRRMRSAIQLSGRNGIGYFAVGILEACLWDIKGKESGLPLWRLFGGGSSAPVPVYASALFRNASIEGLKAEARQLKDAGFQWIKMRVGRPDLDDDLRRIDAVRSIIGDGGKLMMDAAMLWDTRTALERIRAFERFAPFWVEDPVEYHEGTHLGPLAEVRAESPVRIAAGEFQFGIAPFREMIRLRAADFPMVDMLHVGGVTSWLEIVAMARNEGLTVVPHLFPEIAVHVYCIDRPPVPIEWVPWTSELFSDFDHDRGSVRVPSGPGIGLQVPWKKLSSLAVGEPAIVSA